MKDKQPLNIPLIKSRIEITHNNFIELVGKLPEKISADNQFLVKRMKARIEAILKCFVDADVIDIVEGEVTGNSGIDQSCCCLKLTKQGYDKAVYIWTNGVSINIKTAHYPYLSGLDFEDDITIRDVDFDTYNWLEFVDKLLHFIHKVIYARVKSCQKKIFEG